MPSELERLRHRIDELEAIGAENERTAEEVRESEARLRTLFERAPDAFYLSDLKGVFLDGNEAAERLCGYSREELIGKSFLELALLPANEIPRAAKLLALNALGRPTGPDEFTMKRKNAEHATIEIHTIPVTLGGRKTVLGIARDITKRRETEVALRKGEERYVRAATAGKVGVWEWDLSTNAMYIDPNLKELLGFRDDEIGNHLDDWGARVHPDDVEKVTKAADAHLNGDADLYEVEHRMVHKDGSIRWFLARGSAIRDADGSALRMVGSDVDITEQKLAEGERRRLEAEAGAQRAHRLESLGLLAGGIAHDFNNLLTTILGQAGMALAKLPADEHAPVRGMVEKIEEAAMTAAELTHQLLTYAGRGQVATGPTDLNRVIEETTGLIGGSISKKVTLRCDLSESLPSIEADDAQLRRVVMNLVINASEAMEGETGTIWIRTGIATGQPLEDFLEKPSSQGPFAYLDVCDSGKGMSDDTRAKIFDPFFTTKFTGRGLGLAAVRGIVRAHRGGIRLDTKPGGGTTIRVLFAVAAGETPAPGYDAPEMSRRSQMRGVVLLVDDEANVRDVVRHMLEDVGLDVVTAVSGTEAVNAFRMHRDEVRAVVLDLTMPGLDGEETLDQIRQIQSDTPVVFMSGYNDGAARWNDPENQHVAFVQKPFQQQELLTRLGEIWPDKNE